MRAYIIKVIGLAATLVILTVVGVFSVHAPMPSEYWTRDLIVVKKHLLKDLPSPRILIFGGSSVLFAFDAARMERELKVTTFNFGTHAGLRLPFTLSVARSQVKKGDIVLLPLEPVYYTDFYKKWNTWQLRNAMSWDNSPLFTLPLMERIQIYHDAFSADLLRDMLIAKYEIIFHPERVAYRTRTPEEAIKRHYEKKTNIPYEDIDSRGSTNGADDARYNGPSVALDLPAGISDFARPTLKAFIDEMKERGATVYFANCVYFDDGTPYPNAAAANEQFKREIKELGSEVLDDRHQVYLTRAMFFDTSGHINTKGREVRTKVIIDALKPKLKELGLPKDPPTLAPIEP